MASNRYDLRAGLASVFGPQPRFLCGMLLAFVVLGAIDIGKHSMWRDELQAWMIAHDSHSLPDLYNNYRHESHPGLWHLLLYAVSRLTDNPAAMQWLHLAIAAGVAYLLLRFAPFPPLWKALLVFGYFPAYEYALISRCYGLGLLCALVFCILYGRPRTSYYWLVLPLVLMANTSAFGFLLAASFGFLLLAEKAGLLKGQSSDVSSRGGWVVPAIILLGGALLAVCQMIPASDFRFGGFSWSPSARSFQLGKTLAAVWRAYVPLPDTSQSCFWNTNIFDGAIQNGLAYPALLGLALLVGSALLLFRSRVGLCVYCVGSLAVLSFVTVIYSGGIRHVGHLFVVWILSLWLAAAERTPSPTASVSQPALPFRGWQRAFVSALLLVQVGAFATAYVEEWSHPFSSSKECAQYISQLLPQGGTIIGYHDWSTSAVAGYLNQAIYYPERSMPGSFIIWDTKRDRLTPSEFLERIQRFAVASEPVILILNEPNEAILQQLGVRPCAAFTDGIIPDEHFWVCVLGSRTNRTDPLPAPASARETRLPERTAAN